MVDIREYCKGDEKDIIPLFNQVFETNRQEDYWHWQFMENPSDKPIIVVAEDSSKIVGQSTLLPTRMTIKGKEVIAGQSIDTMVSKDYRRQGLYEKMAFGSYDVGIEKGIKFGFRFPSKPALEGALKKLGGTLVDEIPLYINIYRLDNFLLPLVRFKPLAKLFAIPGIVIIKLLHRAAKIKIKEDYIIKQIDIFNKDFDELWNKLEKDSPIMTNRNSSFLNWRIKEHPTIRYRTLGAYLNGELVGYIILKVEDRIVKKTFKLKLGSIVDMVGLNNEIIVALYYKAKEYFKNEDTDFIISWITDSMKYRNQLIELGFHKSKSTVPFVVKDFIGDEELEDLITKEKNWYVMPIETDFY